MFSCDKPGVVMVREAFDDQPKEVKILKAPIANLSATSLPELLPRGGITPERQLYLFKEIRDFVPSAFQDTLCPTPE